MGLSRILLVLSPGHPMPCLVQVSTPPSLQVAPQPATRTGPKGLENACVNSWIPPSREGRVAAPPRNPALSPGGGGVHVRCCRAQVFTPALESVGRTPERNAARAICLRDLRNRVTNEAGMLFMARQMRIRAESKRSGRVEIRGGPALSVCLRNATPYRPSALRGQGNERSRNLIHCTRVANMRPGPMPTAALRFVAGAISQGVRARGCNEERLEGGRRAPRRAAEGLGMSRRAQKESRNVPHSQRVGCCVRHAPEFPARGR